jgi:hypothetical protein
MRLDPLIGVPVELISARNYFISDLHYILMSELKPMVNGERNAGKNQYIYVRFTNIFPRTGKYLNAILTGYKNDG